jgi:hypothetical protein
MSLIKKISGFVLLLGGVVIILYSLNSSYGIFTAKNPAPEIFKAEQKTIQKAGGQDLQAQLEGILQDQLKGLLPAGSLPALLNLVSWSIFAGILILGGGQIAGLGIKLLK